MDAVGVKVTVRRLPATVTQEVLLSCASKCSAEAQLLYFVPGQAKGRRVTLGRAYFRLPNVRAAEAFYGNFMAKWDSFELASKVPPCVEPSPFQRMPRGTERPDEAAGKLEEYAPFQEFMAKLAADKAPKPSADMQLEKRAATAPTRQGQVIISPLLAELIEKKTKKIEEDRKRAAAAAAAGGGDKAAGQTPKGSGASSRRKRGGKRGQRRQGKRATNKKKPEDEK